MYCKYQLTLLFTDALGTHQVRASRWESASATDCIEPSSSFQHSSSWDTVSASWTTWCSKELTSRVGWLLESLSKQRRSPYGGRNRHENNGRAYLQETLSIFAIIITIHECHEWLVWVFQLLQALWLTVGVWRRPILTHNITFIDASQIHVQRCPTGFAKVH